MVQESADLAVVVLGEESYTEKLGDIDDLSLQAGQLKLARAVAATGVPLVLVLISGRPRVLHGLTKRKAAGCSRHYTRRRLCDSPPDPPLLPAHEVNTSPSHAQISAAVIASFLPGPQGGTAIAEVFYGLINPSARLPITYPSSEAVVEPHWHRVTQVLRAVAAKVQIVLSKWCA
eukprot:scaffold30419_cov31-Tisochrysis_lutea.AAC.5